MAVHASSRGPRADTSRAVSLSARVCEMGAHRASCCWRWASVCHTKRGGSKSHVSSSLIAASNGEHTESSHSLPITSAVTEHRQRSVWRSFAVSAADSADCRLLPLLSPRPASALRPGGTGTVPPRRGMARAKPVDPGRDSVRGDWPGASGAGEAAAGVAPLDMAVARSLNDWW